MLEKNLFFIFILLVVVLGLKLFLQTTRPGKCNCSGKCNCNHNTNLKQLLEKDKTITEKNINKAIEKGIIEGFDTFNEIDSNIISYINKDEKINLMFFYKPNCSYCSDFLPTWYKILNNLPNNIMYEEINVSKDTETNKKANDYKITTVPTLILINGKSQIIYKGNRSYNDIKYFLKENGVNLIDKTFEDFDDTGYGTETLPTEPQNPNCPAITFDSQLEVANDDYMYQIFNDRGQYGYAKGGYKENKLLSPFAAAYSTLDSYLSSLPDTEKMAECATLYSKDIRGFGLCDTEKLDEILSYDEKVKNGEAKIRFQGTNYDNNKKVVSAIKKACEL